MSAILDPPRWPGGPRICKEANRPAFESVKEANAFHETNAPGTHMEKVTFCEFCGFFHYKNSPRGPSGESNGSSRYAKHK